MNTHELAWAAGLFDGEGSTSISGGQVRISIVQCGDPHVLHRFKSAVGPGIVYGPYRRSLPHKDRFQFQTHAFETSQAVIAMLWRWLSPPKKRQAAAALRGDRSLMNKTKRGRHPALECPKGHPMTPDNLRWSVIPEGKRRRCLVCSRLYLRDYMRTLRAKRRFMEALLSA